jgi:hypothetical protein
VEKVCRFTWSIEQVMAVAGPFAEGNQRCIAFNPHKAADRGCPRIGPPSGVNRTTYARSEPYRV